MEPVNVPRLNLKSVALLVPEIIGSTTQKTLASPCIRPRSLLSKIFNGILFGWTLSIYRPNLKSVASSVPGIIRLKFWVGIVNPQSWGTGDRRESGMVPFERALANFYRPSMVTFPLSLRVSEILPLLCSSTPLFSHPTSSLPQISPFSTGSTWMIFGLRRAKVSGSTNVTDRLRQTDGQHAIAIPRFAVCSASRGNRST